MTREDLNAQCTKQPVATRHEGIFIGNIYIKLKALDLISALPVHKVIKKTAKHLRYIDEEMKKDPAR